MFSSISTIYKVNSLLINIVLDLSIYRLIILVTINFKIFVMLEKLEKFKIENLQTILGGSRGDDGVLTEGKVETDPRVPAEERC